MTTATKTARPLTVVNDFLVLPLILPARPSFPQKTTHYLYLRAHSPKVPTPDTPRQVFLVNVPIDATERNIRRLFADQLGGSRVEEVAFEGARVVGKGISAPVAPVQQGKKRKRSGEDNSAEEQTPAEVGQLPEVWNREIHRSGGTAVVTFVDKASAEQALKEARRAIKAKREIIWTEGSKEEAPLGVERYRAHHRLRYPQAATLQASVDAYMTALTEQEAARAKALARQRAEPDEDGFITVTRGGRNGPAKEEETKAKQEELKARQKNMVKDDFYRFQVREKKKEQAQDLVRGFEEDRRKVLEMKRRRGKIRPE